MMIIIEKRINIGKGEQRVQSKWKIKMFDCHSTQRAKKTESSRWYYAKEWINIENVEK